MKVRTTLILLVVAAALFAYVMLVERNRGTTDELKKESGKMFVIGKQVNTTKGLSDYVTKLSLKTDKLDLVAKKEKVGDEERWRLAEPLSARADKGEIRGILTDLEFMKKEATVKPDQGKSLDLAKYGLNKPTATITFTAKTGPKGKEKEKTYTLLIGSKTPVGNFVYAKRKDQQVVCTVGDSILSKLKKTLNDFRDKQVVHINKDKVDKIEIAFGKKSFTCSQGKEGWRITKPFTDFAQQDAVKKILD